MDIEQVKPKLNSYLKKIGQHIRVKEAFLFGSLVTGEATSDSDVDVLILSDDFVHLDEDERSKLLYRTSVGIDLDLHVYGLTPEEFASASKLTALGALHQQKTYRLQ